MSISKKKLGLCLALLLLCSCASNVSKDSLASSGEEGSLSSEDIEEDERWGTELCALMKKYCGSVLPYPEGKIGANVSFKEAKDEDGADYLKIYDDSSSFTLGDYYASLVEKGWKATVGYKEEAKRTVGNFLYYEVTKQSGEKGYDVSYTSLSSEDSSLTGNVIYCRNDMTSKTTSKKAWSESESNAIYLALNEDLPFLPLGEGYAVEQVNEDKLVIRDHSLTNLCEAYGDLLEESDYPSNPLLSQLYDMHIYTRSWTKKSISIGLTYKSGNYFTFDFSAYPDRTPEWPSSALEAIESATGVTIPTFPLSSDVPYYYSYTKNGKVYVYAETPTDIEHETDFFSKLRETGFKESIANHYRIEEKGLNLDTKILTNESMGQVEQYGFQIIVYLD